MYRGKTNRRSQLYFVSIYSCAKQAGKLMHFVYRAQWMTVYGRRSLLLFLTPIAIAWSAASILITSAYPDVHDVAYFDDIALHLYLNEPRAYLVASFRVSLHIMNIYQFFSRSFSSNHFLNFLMFLKVTPKFSLQFTIPFLYIQIPFCLCCLAPLLRMETDRIADYLPFLFAWSPVLNPIVVMYFVKDLRPSRKLLSFKSNSNAAEFSKKMNTGQNTNHFLRSRSDGRISDLPKNGLVAKPLTAVTGI
ncbi:unnamed protein product [Haemonchus placei]|uniref:G protein-coupled receptor n=1 Tax=Haemonchus placei TaxID=6290 RepID=A0A0N4W7S1_HAEPC|nr:unnamed protein product [Haemonchus placei]